MTLLLVAVVEMVAGHEEAGRRYEDDVLTLLGRHGGVLERRMRDTTGGAEVQVIRFDERSGLDSFLADPRRAALRAEVGEAAPATRVLEVRDV
ncbi:hypothetical protein AMIS_55410 [Actinoplanes missouriensis 431]|uniref:ABM domain-containing protein n=1 Tax=Actinoplanes missouriensis (strain ATCC 14538 / DSM 43046 / CBS 188.64 / JCM 3121 / NBRC 102363 / NCIMB 12654 / NRRL B-3342 / UNCC 431) TaxID=512565 RepID=I0HCM4_ACTM4|nr:hypothetical protein [Actinoplanes missouriensis]BAL90761.1 hypothetical protein AMIS_55410 [Actinoplanes missouriensis 431]